MMGDLILIKHVWCGMLKLRKQGQYLYIFSEI